MTNPKPPSFYRDGPRRALPDDKSGPSFRRVLQLTTASLALALTGCQTVVGYAWQTSIKRELPGSIATEHFDVRYHPGSRSAAHARRIGAEAELELAKICARLEVKNDVRYTLFLFDNAEEVGNVAHNSAVGGFSFSRFVCVTVSDDAARFHELIHAVAFTKIRGATNSSFIVEGLAGALFEPSQGMDHHSGAKTYRQQGKLPPLAEGLAANTTEGWIAWLNQHADINVYTMAGSWMGFLLETYGPEKTKRYYRGEDPAAVFGAPLAQLEKDWLSALDRYEVPAEIKARMTYAHGQDPARYTAVAGESFKGELPSPPPLPDPSLILKFRWYKDGKEIAGRNGSPLGPEPLSPADTGIYLLAATAESPDGKVVNEAEMAFALKVLPRPADFGEKSAP